MQATIMQTKLMQTNIQIDIIQTNKTQTHIQANTIKTCVGQPEPDYHDSPMMLHNSERKYLEMFVTISARGSL